MKIEETKNEKFHKEFKIQIPFEEVNSKVEEKVSEAAKTFKIAEVAPYMLKVDFGAVNSKTITVNESFWKKLPDEVKTTLQDVALAYRDHVAGIAMDRAKESQEAARPPLQSIRADDMIHKGSHTMCPL